MKDSSDSIEYCYKLSESIEIVERGENIELISENIIRFSVEFSEATLKELSYLKNTGETYSFLPDVEFLTSDLASSKNGPLLLNFLELELLSLSINVNKRLTISVNPIKPLPYSASSLSHSTFFYLSSFCWIRLMNGNFLLQDASQSSQLIIYDFDYMRIISALSKGSTVATLATALGKNFSAIIPSIIKLMLNNNLIHLSLNTSNPTTHNAYENYWSFEDLLFHERSRWGPHNKFIGANFSLDETTPVPSITPTTHSIKEIPLSKPQEGMIDPSFFNTILKRRSYREFGKKPVSIKDLGLLLWFVLHIKSRHEAHAIGRRRSIYEITRRPVPSGGGMHEIEIYLAINCSEEIESGMYHYNAEKHCLEMLRYQDEYCNQLLSDAARAANLSKTPDTLIILGYRPQRIAWKYHGIVYSLVLKHVGIIFQQLYLISTALGLAPCALGVGNSRTFQYATKDDFNQEIIYSVGEFIVGSKPDSENLD